MALSAERSAPVQAGIAFNPQQGLDDDLGGESNIQAVFLNYLLDCLPAAILEIGDGGVRQLCVWTHFRREPGTENGVVMSAKVAELQKSDSPEHRRELRSLADSFVAEYEFQECDWANIPEPHCFDKEPSKRRVVVHSFGAIRCLERLVKVLAPSGFILMNDYGARENKGDDDWFEHQRYSGATFVGVNFDELKCYFQGDSYQVVEPLEGSESLFSRLLGRHDIPSEVAEKFAALFSKKKLGERSDQKAKAKGWLGYQRFEGALSVYRRILEEQPYDWTCLSEVAELLGFGLCDPAAGLSAIREAIAINPSCSSRLWDIAGELLLEVGQPHEARKALLRAIEIDSDDVRARLALARVHMATKDWQAALESIADGMACSRDPKWTQQLLAKQAEVLNELGRSHRDAFRRLSNRIRQVGVSQGDNQHSTESVSNWPSSY